MPSKFEIDALDSTGCGLQAVFQRRGDRYEHRVVAVAGGVKTPLLIAENWPVQEIVDHRDAAGVRTLLITGAGEGRYWSASIAAIVDERLAILSFDVACREAARSQAPAVEYRLAEGAVWSESAIIANEGRRIEPVAGAIPTSLATEAVPTCLIEIAQTRVLFRSAARPHVTTATTTRWRYELRFMRPADENQ